MSCTSSCSRQRSFAPSAVNICLSLGEYNCICEEYLGLRRKGEVAALVDALDSGAAVQTQLQVLGGIVSLSQLLGDSHRQGQIATELSDDNRDADVARVQLHVGPHFAGGAVVRHGLVDPLVGAALIGLEDNSYCKGISTFENRMGFVCASQLSSGSRRGIP
uniref:Uncharacterized protein n=1 Tax=Hippocampus comes TaxID=109280 RepID=A0A3Q2Z1T8_HIPCM